MSEFLKRAETDIQERKLFSRGQRVLVAVSGGVDSMALLHALHSLAKKNHWRLSVAHFNHHLRGRASDADEKLVRQTAAKLRLKFFSGGDDVKRFAAQSKISMEMAARRLRHEFLARTAREQKIVTIALAHHANDQVELFFLRLLRGAGGEGLAGMKWRSPSPADRTISLVRPLLEFPKVELLEFVRENKIRFRDDATNFSTDFLRNRIRHELLPLLRKKYQPGLDKTVLRVMDIVGAEAEFVGEFAESWLQKFRGNRNNEAQTKISNRQSAVGNQSEPPRVGCHGFVELPLAVQRKVLQRRLTGLGLLPDFELIERLRESPDKWMDVCAGLSVARDAAGKVHCQEQTANEFNPAELGLKLSGRDGRAEFGGGKFLWRVEPMKKFQMPPRKTGVEMFDADKVGGEIILRHWRPGDRFQPIGLKSPVKLQDLFVNAKIPAARRRELVLAADDTGGIFWVEELRIGERFKLTPETRRKLVWKWSKLAG